MTNPNLDALKIQDSQRGAAPGSWKKTLAVILLILLLGFYIGWKLWERFQPRINVSYAQVLTRTGVVDMNGARRTGSFEAAGWIEPEPYAEIVPTLIEGWVTKVHVIEGSLVKKGDPIADIYDEDYKSKLELAKAKREKAKADVDYWAAQESIDEKLCADGALDALALARTKSEKARADAEFRVAGQEEILAKRDLDRCVITATRDGAILDRFVEPGSHLMPSGHVAAVVSMYDPGKIWVRVDVDLPDLPKVFVGQQASIRVESEGDSRFDGTVIQMLYKADNQKNTVQVKVRIEKPTELLRPEMIARVRFLPKEEAGPEPGSGTETLMRMVPQNAIIDEGGQNYVYVVEGNGLKTRAKKIFVRVGFGRHEDLVEIQEGLNATSKVIVDGLEGIKDGALITASPKR